MNVATLYQQLNLLCICIQRVQVTKGYSYLYDTNFISQYQLKCFVILLDSSNEFL